MSNESQSDKPDQEQGLYRKYNVERLNDPTGKHADCHYYILDLDHDKFSVPALMAYAEACATEFPTLAFDLRHTAAATSRKLNYNPSLSRPSLAPLKGDALYASHGYALATRVLQSDLYAQLDDRERAECDALVRGQAPVSPRVTLTDAEWDAQMFQGEEKDRYSLGYNAGVAKIRYLLSRSHTEPSVESGSGQQISQPGWKMMPPHPTEEMFQAADEANDGSDRSVYEAMFGAIK